MSVTNDADIVTDLRLFNHRAAADRLEALTTPNYCRCNIGVQSCPVHPGRLKTQEEKIAFRKAWDARVLS